MDKFIVTFEKSMADKLLSQGFQLVSNIGDSYYFMNTTPKNFTFSKEDKKHIAYTNMIAI